MPQGLPDRPRAKDGPHQSNQEVAIQHLNLYRGQQEQNRGPSMQEVVFEQQGQLQDQQDPHRRPSIQGLVMEKLCLGMSEALLRVTGPGPHGVLIPNRNPEIGQQV